MILRHRLHCIIVKAKRREGPSGGGAGSSSSYRPASPAKWEDGHCASEKVCKGGCLALRSRGLPDIFILLSLGSACFYETVFWCISSRTCSEPVLVSASTPIRSSSTRSSLIAALRRSPLPPPLYLPPP